MFSHITKDFFGNKFSYSIGLAFITLGFLFGNWATFIPFIKSKFILNDAQLGLLLLSMPFGALIMNPLAASLVRKIGMQNTTIYGLYCLLISFSLLLNMPNIFLLSFMLFLCGSSIAITNVGMNTCVGALEYNFAFNIMSTCHGMFSLGLMSGSLTSSLSNKIELTPGKYMILISVILLAFILLAKPVIMKIKDKVIEENAIYNKFAFPKGMFLVMIIIGLCINITEGTMADWTAVYMRDVIHTQPAFEGWALASYSLFMALGRFSGDKIIPQYGANNILIYGGLLSITGIVIAIFLPFAASAIIGFALVGAGVSCGAPILYASAARIPNMAKGSGLAVMNMFAMGGFLFGPVIIGFISEATSLPIAFGVVAILGLVWVYKSKKVALY